MQKKFTIPAAHFVVPTDAPPGCEPSKLRGTLGTAAHVWADDPFPKCPPGHHEVVTGPDANGQYTVEFLPVAPPSAADVLSAIADLSLLVSRSAVPSAITTATTVDPAGEYVTLNQMAAMVRKSKRTLEKYVRRKQNPLPNPDKEGGGGKAHEWIWERVRPWLEDTFDYSLPIVFPAARPPVSPAIRRNRS